VKLEFSRTKEIPLIRRKRAPFVMMGIPKQKTYGEDLVIPPCTWTGLY
jgi:hypothetical protein